MSDVALQVAVTLAWIDGELADTPATLRAARRDHDYGREAMTLHRIDRLLDRRLALTKP